VIGAKLLTAAGVAKQLLNCAVVLPAHDSRNGWPAVGFTQNTPGANPPVPPFCTVIVGPLRLVHARANVVDTVWPSITAVTGSLMGTGWSMLGVWLHPMNVLSVLPVQATRVYWFGAVLPTVITARPWAGWK
jgi:hypothetical protein